MVLNVCFPDVLLVSLVCFFFFFFFGGGGVNNKLRNLNAFFIFFCGFSRVFDRCFVFSCLQ